MARGRKPGTRDNVNIRIKTLVDSLPQGSETVIPIRRKWLEQMEDVLDLKFETEESTVQTVKNDATAKEAEPRERVQMVEEEL